MPPIELDRLSDEATVWVFGITPALDEKKIAYLLPHIDGFLEQWAAHRVPVESGREIREGSFLIIAAEKNTETSGCSIDSMFGLVRQIEAALKISMLDAGKVYYRGEDGRVTSATRSEFSDNASPETIVFDTTVQTLGEIRNGSWERPARDSWHKSLLRATA